MEVVIILVVAVAIAVIVIVFNQSSIGKVGSALSANDVGVIAAATGCSSELAAGPVDPQKKFCYEFKTIEKKSFLGFSTQLVNCEYLNNTIKTTISNADYYSEVRCPSSVWAEKCQLLLNENSGDASYEMLVNGKLCSKKALDSTPNTVKTSTPNTAKTEPASEKYVSFKNYCTSNNGQVTSIKTKDINCAPSNILENGVTYYCCKSKYSNIYKDY